MTLSIKPGMTLLEAQYAIYRVVKERLQTGSMETPPDLDYDTYQGYDHLLLWDYFYNTYLGRGESMNVSGVCPFLAHVVERPNRDPYAYEMVGKTYDTIYSEVYGTLAQSMPNRGSYTCPVIYGLDRKSHSEYSLEQFFQIDTTLDDYGTGKKALIPRTNFYEINLQYHAMYWDLILQKIRSYPQVNISTYTTSVQLVRRYVYYPGSSHYFSDFIYKTEQEMIDEAVNHLNSIINSLSVNSTARLDFVSGRVLNKKSYSDMFYRYDPDWGFFYNIPSMYIESLHYIEISNPRFKSYNSYSQEYYSTRINQGCDIELTKVQTNSPYDGYLEGTDIVESLYSGTVTTSGDKYQNTSSYMSKIPDYTYYYTESLDGDGMKTILINSIGIKNADNETVGSTFEAEACAYLKYKQHDSNFVL